jgi:hypothetical protein
MLEAIEKKEDSMGSFDRTRGCAKFSSALHPAAVRSPPPSKKQFHAVKKISTTEEQPCLLPIAKILGKWKARARPEALHLLQSV